MKEIVSHFKINGKLLSIKETGNGHINKTYIVKTDQTAYTLQRINNYVFKNVDALMNNFCYVTGYLDSLGVDTLVLVPTKDSRYYWPAKDGFYRMYRYLDNVVTHEKQSNLHMTYMSGKAFGKFHKDLSGIDASKLFEVIPDFHNTPKRYKNLLKAISEDKFNRKKNCLTEINIIKDKKDTFDMITSKLENKEIPLTVTHNDPKLNNVLFDQETDEVKCIIDLDTVMPGSVLYDFGDALRSLFTGEYEDSKNLNQLKANPEIFESYLKGYLSEMKSILNDEEIKLLAYAPYVLSIELGMRFLEDYLNGDVYFGAKSDEHNLIRARTQIALANNIYDNINELKDIVNKYI